MTTEEFSASIERLGVPMREAAALLGIHFTGAYKIMRGEQTVPPYLGVSLRNLLKLQRLEEKIAARKDSRSSNQTLDEQSAVKAEVEPSTAQPDQTADLAAMSAALQRVEERLDRIENQMSTGLSLKQAVALIRGIQASLDGTPIGVPDETYFGFDRPDPENAIASVEVQAWQDFYARRARESAGTAAERENKATPSAKDDPK